MKKANDFFSVITVIAALLFGIFIFEGCKKDTKFKNQKLGVSIEKFKSDWEKPNKEFIYNDGDGSLILVYNSGNCIGDKYIFKFNKTSESLTCKYYDD